MSSDGILFLRSSVKISKVIKTFKWEDQQTDIHVSRSFHTVTSPSSGKNFG